MKIKNLNRYIKSADQTVFGLDLLKLNLKQKIKFLSDILSTVDFDNSNMLGREIGGFEMSFIKIMTPNGPAINVSLSIENVPYTLFQYLEYNDKRKKMFNSEGSFTYYGTYFRLLEINKLSYTFEKEFLGDEFDKMQSSPISRVDYKIDFCYKEPTTILPLKKIIDYRSYAKSTQFALTSDEYQKHWDLMWSKLKGGESIKYQSKSEFTKGDFQTGRNIGNKGNKSIYARCYEKLVDSIAKGKVRLYDDYFLFSNVFRLEFEFRVKFNKDKNNKTYIYANLSDLEHKIHRFLGLAEGIEGENFIYQYKKNDITDFIDIGRYQKDFGGRGYGLIMQGFNPFIILLAFLRRKEVLLKTINSLVSEFFDHFNAWQIHKK